MKLSEVKVDDGLVNPWIWIVNYTPVVVKLFKNQSWIERSLFNVVQFKLVWSGNIPLQIGVIGGFTELGDHM